MFYFWCVPGSNQIPPIPFDFRLSAYQNYHTHALSLTHTQFFLSPEEKMTRTVQERERLRPAEPDHYTHDHRSSTSRSRVGALSRATNDRAIDSPPPINLRRTMYSGR